MFFFFQGLVEMKTLDIFQGWYSYFSSAYPTEASSACGFDSGEDVPGEMWVRPLRHWSRSHHSLFAGSDFEVEISGRNNTCGS